MSNYGLASRTESGLPLFDQDNHRAENARPTQREQREEETNRARFADFHARNPIVYTTLVSEAKRWRQRFPGKRCSIWFLGNRVRWVLQVETDTPDDGEPYKINNNFWAHYARLIMEREPNLEGVFELRALHTDSEGVRDA